MYIIKTSSLIWKLKYEEKINKIRSSCVSWNISPPNFHICLKYSFLHFLRKIPILYCKSSNSKGIFLDKITPPYLIKLQDIHSSTLFNTDIHLVKQSGIALQLKEITILQISLSFELLFWVSFIRNLRLLFRCKCYSSCIIFREKNSKVLIQPWFGERSPKSLRFCNSCSTFKVPIKYRFRNANLIFHSLIL